MLCSRSVKSRCLKNAQENLNSATSGRICLPITFVHVEVIVFQIFQNEWKQIWTIEGVPAVELIPTLSLYLESEYNLFIWKGHYNKFSTTSVIISPICSK